MCACVHMYLCVCTFSRATRVSIDAFALSASCSSVIYVCIYIHIYTCTYMCVYICMHICVCIYIYICVYIYIFSRYARQHRCLCTICVVLLWDIRVYIHTCIYVCVFIYTCMCMCVYTYMHICVWIYVLSPYAHQHRRLCTLRIVLLCDILYISRAHTSGRVEQGVAWTTSIQMGSGRQNMSKEIRDLHICQKRQTYMTKETYTMSLDRELDRVRALRHIPTEKWTVRRDMWCA